MWRGRVFLYIINLMKVGGSGRVDRSQKSSKSSGAQKTGDSTFSSMVGGAGASAASSGAGGVAGVAGIEALLAVQGAGDATESTPRRRMVERGDDLIETLEEIRIGLISGTMTMDQIRRIAQMVNSKREQLDDPLLNEVIDDIDLRAQVEMAKLEKMAL